MEQRIMFKKGKQRKFLDLAISRLKCVSLRGILQFGFNIPYSSLKNYYVERRLLPNSFFMDICRIAKIDIDKLNIKRINGNWGQVKGGEKSRR